MVNAYQRKKDPEHIRKLILENTMILAAEKGVSGVSIQTVADMAGVTKGGVFHHFPNKKALLEAMLHFVMSQIDAETEKLICADTESYGCFTRAYIEITLNANATAVSRYWDAISMTMMTEPDLNAIWAQWLEKRLSIHADTDQSVQLKILRYAADGVWLTGFAEMKLAEDFIKMKQELISRTYPASSQSFNGL